MSPRARLARARGRPSYRSEQHSLERAFEELDPNVISAVLERRGGDVDLAAADLLELKPAKGKREDGSAEKRARLNDAGYWGGVLEDERGKEDEEGDRGLAYAREVIRSMHAWVEDQWTR